MLIKTAFIQKYSKYSNTVKYYYNLKQLCSFSLFLWWQS